MEKEELIERLEANFNEIIALCSNAFEKQITTEKALTDVYSANSHNFDLTAQFEAYDKEKTDILKTFIANIQNSFDLKTIHDAAVKALEALKVEKEVKETYLRKVYGEILRIVRTPEYEKSCRRHKNVLTFIKDTEADILKASHYASKLHECITSGKWKDCPHARVTENFRLMYIIDTEQKKLILIEVIGHEAFDSDARKHSVDWIKKYRDL